tara:strand:+ start:2192 stop:3892 length:1701 start_codon:yes stop_codon:yes gene_type:complete
MAQEDFKLSSRDSKTTLDGTEQVHVITSGKSWRMLLTTLITKATSYLNLGDTADTTYVNKDGFVPMVGYDASLPAPLTGEPNGLILTKIPAFTDIVQGNAILKGGVIKVTGANLDYIAWGTSYIINNEHYTTPIFDTVTLSNGDATHGRIDVFIIRMTGTTPSIVVLEGTPSASPVKPVPNLLTEVEISFSTVLALATSDPVVVTELIYDENTGEPGEWANTVLMAGGDLADTTLPYQGTLCVSLPAVTSGIITWANAALLTFDSGQSLNFAMKVPSVFPNPGSIQVKLINSVSSDYWLLTLTPRNLRDYGYVTSDVAWQVVTIKLAELTASNPLATQYDTLEMTFKNTSITYLDWLNTQGGQVQPPQAWVEEAPNDGSSYVRNSEAWQVAAGGGDAQTANPLSQFAPTTSAQLASVLSDETGTGLVVFNDSPVINTAISGTAVLDEDTMSSNSATQIATQQSIKAYVDAEVAENLNVVGSIGAATLALDFDAYEGWDAILSEALTLSITNPQFKVVTVDLTGNFGITYPASSTVVGDTYDGTVRNTLTIHWTDASNILIIVTNWT